MTLKVSGGCHCGAVTYEAEVDPGAMAICHCQDCQMLTGTAFRANIAASAASFRLLTGTPQRYIKTAASGAQRVHAFCGACGTPVFSCAVENPPSFSLRVGALRERGQLQPPARQIWTKRRLAWVTQLADVPADAEQP
jgi:hypothetical protein